MEKQRKGSYRHKFSFIDMKRLSKFLSYNIFGNTCTPWTGPTVSGIPSFHFDNEKRYLRKLMYANFIGPILPSQKLKNCATCKHCITISHLRKQEATYSRKSKETVLRKKPKLSLYFSID